MLPSAATGMMETEAGEESSSLKLALYSLLCTAHFQMFKLDLEKAEEPEIKQPTSVGS